MRMTLSVILISAAAYAASDGLSEDPLLDGCDEAVKARLAHPASYDRTVSHRVDRSIPQARYVAMMAGRTAEDRGAGAEDYRLTRLYVRYTARDGRGQQSPQIAQCDFVSAHDAAGAVLDWQLFVDGQGAGLGAV